MLPRLTLFFVLFYAGCVNSTKLKKQPVKFYEVQKVIPNHDTTGKLTDYSTLSLFIYKLGDTTVYKIPYTYDSISSAGEVLKHEIRYRHFVCSGKNNWGYIYNETRPKEHQRIFTDSMLLRYGFTGFNVYKNFDRYDYKKVDSIYDKKNGTLKENYIVYGKNDTTPIGTTDFTYSQQFKELDYSLSPELDSIKKLKLFKIEIINNERYVAEFNISLEKDRRTIEIKNASADNLHLVQSFIQRYRKETSSPEK
jgi:hypothetical protein